MKLDPLDWVVIVAALVGVYLLVAVIVPRVALPDHTQEPFRE